MAGYFSGVIGLYYSLFFYLEGINILDVDNDLHLFCLHYIFIPRINRHLEMWRQAWIKHPLSSEHSMTPEQLWTSGLQNIAYSGSHIAKEVFEDLSEVCTYYVRMYIYTYMHACMFVSMYHIYIG